MARAALVGGYQGEGTLYSPDFQSCDKDRRATCLVTRALWADAGVGGAGGVAES